MAAALLVMVVVVVEECDCWRGRCVRKNFTNKCRGGISIFTSRYVTPSLAFWP